MSNPHAARISAAIGRLGMELEDAGFEPGEFAIALRSPGAVDRLRWISKGELVRDDHAPHGKAATWCATIAGVEVHKLGIDTAALPLAEAIEAAIADLNEIRFRRDVEDPLDVLTAALRRHREVRR